MAKEKVEQELTVEEKLRALYELQTVNSKIDNLRILAGELPQETRYRISQGSASSVCRKRRFLPLCGLSEGYCIRC